MAQQDSPSSASVIDAATVDLNGVWRGKRLPMSKLDTALKNGIRMPAAVQAMDIWGRDIDDGRFVFATGDHDGLCLPTGRGPLETSWRERPNLLLPLWSFGEDNGPNPYDPRHCLATVIADAKKMGLTPVVAAELEFYLVDPSDHSTAPPKSLLTGERRTMDQILSVDELNHFREFFDRVFEACASWGITAEAATSEAGGGQYEVNFNHSDDPLKAADDAVLFKYIVRDIARSLGLAATFMAKPFAGHSGNGLHVHMSMLDERGANVFDNGQDEGSPKLHQAIAGLLDGMHASTLIFAPHLNSYRRLRPGAHAPAAVGWGYENRTTAIRIPGGAPAARRLEHRVAGADANPYLVLAAVIGGALAGIREGLQPPAPVAGSAYDAGLPNLPVDWRAAIDAFGASSFAANMMPAVTQEIFTAMKRQEFNRWAEEISAFEYQTYMELV